MPIEARYSPTDFASSKTRFSTGNLTIAMVSYLPACPRKNRASRPSLPGSTAFAQLLPARIPESRGALSPGRGRCPTCKDRDAAAKPVSVRVQFERLLDGRGERRHVLAVL